MSATEIELEPANPPIDPVPAIVPTQIVGTPIIDNTLVRQVFNKVVESIHTRKFDASTAIRMILTVMAAAEKVKNLTGAQKKELVVDVIDMIINDSGLVKPEDREIMSMLIQQVGPSVIEVAIDASHGIGNLNIGKIKKFFKKLCSCQ